MDLVCQQCFALTEALKTETRHFALGENWHIVCDTLQEAARGLHDTTRRLLVTDTITLLEGTLSVEKYRQRWVSKSENSASSPA